MSIFITVGVVLVVLALLGLGVCWVSALLAERKERRLALQRTLVIQCADQRMRAASQQAFGAMLRVVDQRLDRR